MSRALTRTRGTFALGETKTKKSQRTIRLTTGAVEAHRVHLSRQLEEMERMGSLYQPGGLIFATKVGTVINHDLRHTCATLLLSKNVNPKVVSEMLGHTSVGITLDTYSHLMPDMQETAARALEDSIS